MVVGRRVRAGLVSDSCSVQSKLSLSDDKLFPTLSCAKAVASLAAAFRSKHDEVIDSLFGTQKGS